MSSEVETSLAAMTGNAEIIRDSSNPLRFARNDREHVPTYPHGHVEEYTFAQHQIDLMVEHFVYCSVEPRKISRVKIADMPDNVIMTHGSAD
jgi:hypothetical protein